MEAYTSFAKTYDMFMDNVPYEEWAEYLIGLLHEHGMDQGTIVDLGCGTGKITRLLAREGYDMIGVDLSEDMLSIAVNDEDSTGILYLHQDMRELELYQQADAMVSICDSMNYILETEGLAEVFQRVNAYLREGGVFIFDLNTIYKYKELIGETTICENRETGSFIWENYYDEKEQINEYDLTLFIAEEDGRFRRFEEVHYQRGYELVTVRALLEGAGMEFVAAYDAFTHDPVREDSERIYVIARAGK